MPALPTETEGWGTGGGGRRWSDGAGLWSRSIRHVALTESGEADCYSKFCMSGSLNESMTGI